MRKFPILQQHNVMDCGPTCIAMIAKYYGINEMQLPCILPQLFLYSIPIFFTYCSNSSRFMIATFLTRER